MRILTIEDEESTAAAMQLLLKKKLQATVEIATDCVQARNLLRSNSYDLVTLDYQLPDGDGLDLLEEIVATRGEIPVLIVTGRGDESIAVSALKLGAAGYVVKDSQISTVLVDEVRSLLSKSKVKKAGHEQRKSEERYRFLFENMLEGFALCRMIYDRDGKPVDFEYVEANRAFSKLTGLKDVEGKRISELFPDLGKFLPNAFEVVGRVASTGTPEQFDLWLEPLSTYVSIKVHSPANDYFVVLIEDITEKKKDEEKLRTSESLLKVAERISKVGGWWFDVRKKTVSLTEEAFHILDLDPNVLDFGDVDQIIKKSIKCFDPRDRDKIIAAYDRCATDGLPFDLDLPFTTHSGIRLRVRIAGEAVYEGGVIVKIAGSLMDMTGQKAILK